MQPPSPLNSIRPVLINFGSHEDEFSSVSYSPQSTGIKYVAEIILNVLTLNLYFICKTLDQVKDIQKDLVAIHNALNRLHKGQMKKVTLSDNNEYEITNNDDEDSVTIRSVSATNSSPITIWRSADEITDTIRQHIKENIYDYIWNIGADRDYLGRDEQELTSKILSTMDPHSPETKEALYELRRNDVRKRIHNSHLLNFAGARDDGLRVINTALKGSDQLEICSNKDIHNSFVGRDSLYLRELLIGLNNVKDPFIAIGTVEDRLIAKRYFTQLSNLPWLKNSDQDTTEMRRAELFENIRAARIFLSKFSK
jgi:hypothetical protein